MGFINAIMQNMPDNFNVYYAHATFWATMCGAGVPNSLYNFTELGGIPMPTSMQISNTLLYLQDLKSNNMVPEFSNLNRAGVSSRNYTYLQSVVKYSEHLLEECRERYSVSPFNSGSDFIHSNGYTSEKTVYKGKLNWSWIKKEYPGLRPTLDHRIINGIAGHPIYVLYNGDGTCDVCVLTHSVVSELGFIYIGVDVNDLSQRHNYLSDFIYRIPVDYLGKLVAVTSELSLNLNIDKNAALELQNKSSALLGSVNTVLEHMSNRQNTVMTPLKLAICNGVPLQYGGTLNTPELFNKTMNLNNYIKFVDLKDLALKMENFNNWRK